MDTDRAGKPAPLGLATNRNRASTLGAVRQGAALLAGLVVCGRCGTRLGVHYQQSHGRLTPFYRK